MGKIFQEVAMDLDMISFLVSTSIYIILGTIGNTLVIAVYLSKKRQFPRRAYILSLAITDLVIVVLVAPYSIVFQLRQVKSSFACHAFEVFRHTAIGFSNLILILIAWERLMMVWRPLKAMESTTKLSFMIGFFLFAMLCSSPAALVYNVSYHNSTQSGNGTQAQQKYCAHTTSILGKQKTLWFRNMISFLMGVEFLILIITYSLVYVLIYRHRKRAPRSYVGSNIRNRVGKQDSNESQTRSARLIDNGRGDDRDMSNIASTPLCQVVQTDSNEADDDMKERSSARLESAPLQQVEDTDSKVITTDENLNSRKSKISNGKQDDKLESIYLEKDSERNEIAQENSSSRDLQSFRYEGAESNTINLERTPVSEENDHRQESMYLNNNQSSQGTSSVSSPPLKGSQKRQNSTNSRIVTSAKRRPTMQAKTWTMLTICTFLYVICWIPYSFYAFEVTKGLIFQYCFFIAHASNPIVYSVVNVRVRRGIKELFTRKSHSRTNSTVQTSSTNASTSSNV
ncbi:dopamine D2-like receptor [Saccostrea cucullata]|uniref:dopamine D2-like receptor n=1 Tax=Saccostrea cuccullata TaxID=36930 RepID=UPI002ED2878C